MPGRKMIGKLRSASGSGPDLDADLTKADCFRHKFIARKQGLLRSSPHNALDYPTTCGSIHTFRPWLTFALGSETGVRFGGKDADQAFVTVPVKILARQTVCPLSDRGAGVGGVASRSAETPAYFASFFSARSK